jgi:hypothetical protein
MLRPEGGSGGRGHGARGTDVARETADLVLVDDSFSSLLAAVRSGVFLALLLGSYFLVRRARGQGARSNPLVGLLGGAVALVLLLLLLPPLRRLLDLGPLHFPALAGRLGTALVCGALLWASRRAQRVSALAT